MPPRKERTGTRDVYGEERSRVSCCNVYELFRSRPWVVGEIIETEMNSPEDRAGVDMFVPVDERLADFMCLEQGVYGILVQVKSGQGNENEFAKDHRPRMLNLASGENIFVINGQEEKNVMLASMVAQIVAMTCLTGYVSEEVMLGFLAEDLGDKEAVMAYRKNKQFLIRNKWFKRYIDGSNIDE